MSNNKEIHILLIDDDEEDILLTRDYISDIPHRNYKVDAVSNYDDGLKEISKCVHDIFLVDNILGGRSGLELIQEAIQSGCKAPMILLTGQSTPEVDEKAIKIGAADFLEKGMLNSVLLDRTIRYALKNFAVQGQLREMHERSEQLVIERTKELGETVQKLEKTNQDLIKQNLERKKAEERLHVALAKEKNLGELKSRFVSMASHEFRTPLGTILSSVSLIDKYAKNEDIEKRQKHILRIKSTVKNMTELLNDFLSIGKIEEGKVENYSEVFDIEIFCCEIKEEMQALAKSGQHIQYTHTAPYKEVIIDRKILKTVLVNLLSNATKYSAENKIINFETSIENNLLTITIADQGIGIPEDDQKMIFETFFRAQNATNIEGTGLGLNIVKKYVDLMNGKISFISLPFVGTTFNVHLPANQQNLLDKDEKNSAD